VRGRQSGAVTLELAAAIPMLAAFTVALVGVVALAGSKLLAQDAARAGAREGAISGSERRAAAAARAALPAGRDASVRVLRPAPGLMRVEVRLAAALYPAGRVSLTAVAVAAVEPDAVAGAAPAAGPRPGR
jgi:hypothetical protein